MRHRPGERPPQQARSRHTQKRLLDAAEAVLARRGMERATLAEIARHAKMSPANVYRRFHNKQALLQAVFRRFNERSAAATHDLIDPEAIRPLGLAGFSRRVIEGMIDGHRANAALSRVAVEFSERHWDLGFIRQSRRSEARSFEVMVQAFLTWRSEIRHPDPDYAVRFAITMVACILRELVIFNRTSVFADVVQLDDERLKGELPRMFLRYLAGDSRWPTSRTSAQSPPRRSPPPK